MVNLIDDEEIHALDSEHGYILFIGNLDRDDTKRLRKKFIEKYAEYILRTNYQGALDLLFLALVDHCEGNDFEFIHTHAHQSSILQQKSTFALKFKRSPKDYL